MTHNAIRSIYEMSTLEKYQHKVLANFQTLPYVCNIVDASIKNTYRACAVCPVSYTSSIMGFINRLMLINFISASMRLAQKCGTRLLLLAFDFNLFGVNDDTISH